MSDFPLFFTTRVHCLTYCIYVCFFLLRAQELLKYSTDCEGTSELQGALTAMLDLLKSVNDSMHQIAITGYEVTQICPDLCLTNKN